MPDPMLLLRLGRLTFLRPRERIVIAYHLRSDEQFRRLSLRDLSQLVKRPLSGARQAEEATAFDLVRDREALEADDFSLVSFFDEAYPPRLRHIFDPPLMLYCRGNRDLLHHLDTVSVVGTRVATMDGLEAARRLAEGVAASGYPVVSGLARGIDGAAHRGALRYPGGRTVAVLGSAVDRVYPSRNQPLGREILACGGLLVSEYAPGTPARKFHFPQRNRIIAGVSELLWVIQAPAGSGALITADHAIDQNREVVCHSVGTTPGSRNLGTRKLAEEGAKVWSDWESFLRNGEWPPMPPEEATVEELLREWGYLPGENETKETRSGGKRRGRRSRVARKSKEMFDGQQLLSLFTGDEEELEA